MQNVHLLQKNEVDALILWEEQFFLVGGKEKALQSIRK